VLGGVNVEGGAGWLPGVLRRCGSRWHLGCVRRLRRKFSSHALCPLGVLAGHHLSLARGLCVPCGLRGTLNLGVLLCFGFVVGAAAFCFHGFLHSLASFLASLSP